MESHRQRGHPDIATARRVRACLRSRSSSLRHKAPLFLTKAKQFCESAVQQLQDGRFDSTVLCAVHAGISTADAVCIGIGGRRSGDPNHLVAAALLEEVGRNSSEYRTK